MNIVSNHNRLLRGAAIPTAGGDMWTSGLEYTQNGEISGYSGSAFYQQECPCDSAAIVDSAFNKSTAWVDEQNYLTAHQDVTNLPYVQNSALEFSPQGLISGISGSGLYATSAENAFTADTAYFAYNSEHADSADYTENAYSAQFANSASSALNAEVANVSYTALTANFLDGGWELDVDGFITAYNNSAFAGGGAGGMEYTGISPIVVNNEKHLISAESARLGVQNPLYFVEDSVSATVIGIYDSALSGRDWSDDITAASANALNEAINQITAVASANSATYDSDGNKITETYISAHQDVSNLPYVQNSALEYSPGGHLVSSISGDGLYAMSADGAFTAETANYSYVAETANYVADGWEYNESNEITGYSGSAIHSEAPSEGKVYTGVAPIVVDNSQTTGVISAETARLGVQSPLYFVEDTSSSTVIGISGLPEVEGLMYESALNFGDGYITGYNGSALSSERSRYAVSSTSANGAVSSQTAAIVTGGWETANGKITGYNGTAFSAGSTYDVKASSNISVATAGTTFTVSGKDWQNTITAASSYAYNQATAKDKTYDVTAGPYSNIVVTTAGNTFGLSGRDWIPTIASYTSYVYSQATANASGKYIPYTNITTGISGTTVYNVASGIRVTSNSGWTEIYNKNKENENEAHLQVAQNYSDGKSFWSELDGAGGGFLQLNWNSGTIGPNSHSSYSLETTASLNIGKSHIHYYEGEQVDGHIPPVWSIEPGLIQLYDYNNYGASANYSYEGFEIHPNPGAMYKAYYEVNTHKFRIKGSYGANTSGVIDVTPGYINFYDPDYNFISYYSNYGFHVKQNDHSYFETKHDDDTNITVLRVHGDLGNTTGTLDLTPGFIQFYDSAWNVAAFLGPWEINQLKALLNHVQSASASWVNPPTATGSI